MPTFQSCRCPRVFLRSCRPAPGLRRMASAQPITPAMEQEFLDAKNAVDSAQKAQAEKYAPEPLKQAQDLLVTAENARGFKDAVKFAQVSRLSRAYAELARATAELRAEEEKLAATRNSCGRPKRRSSA